MFTKDELLKIMEYAQETSHATFRVYSRMMQKGFRCPNGSIPSQGQIDAVYTEGKVAGEIFNKAKEMIQRIEFPAKTGYQAI